MNKPKKKKKNKSKQVFTGGIPRPWYQLVPTGTTEKRVFLRGGNTIVTLPGGQKVNFRDTTDNKCQPKGIIYLHPVLTITRQKKSQLIIP